MATARRSTGRRSATKPAVDTGAKRAADQTAARAKRAGATGPHGSDRMRSIRDSAIIARVGCGVPHREVAQEFRRQRSHDQRRDRACPEGTVAAWIARGWSWWKEQLLAFHRRIITDLLALANAHKTSNAPVALGALKAAGVAADRYDGLLEATGKLPSLDLVRSEADLMRLGDLILSKLRDLVAGEVTGAELEAFVHEAIMQRTLPRYEMRMCELASRSLWLAGGNLLRWFASRPLGSQQKPGEQAASRGAAGSGRHGARTGSGSPYRSVSEASGPA